VVAQLKNSLDKWTAQCGVTHVYDGDTSVAPTSTADVNAAHGDGANVVGWGPLDATLSGWTYDWWTQSGNQRVLFETDVTLNAANVKTIADLDRVMTHEWGHALGLDHSNVQASAMAGPPMTYYNGMTVPQTDDVQGCRCLYGLPSGMSAPYVCSLPTQTDLGTYAVGSMSAPQSLTLTNSGNAPLVIQSSSMSNANFKHVAGCQPGTTVSPGASCTLQVQGTPVNPGATIGQLTLVTNGGDYQIPLQVNGTAGWASALPPTMEVVEYYNASLDHYFITWIAAEMDNLDAGKTPTRWTRTGKSFRVPASAVSGTSQVCRLYIPPSEGDSHFFGRNATECLASQQAHPGFVLEDPNYMQIYMPAAGACPSGTQPVYRLFNNRRDANHRYVTDRASRDSMIAKGWIAEGDGADIVAMCVSAE
jgi:hypothetical protein